MTTPAQLQAHLMRQAYLDFLDWATRKKEFLQEYSKIIGKDAYEDMEGFCKYITETYWGDEGTDK